MLIQCSRNCGPPKPLSAFPKNSTKPLGVEKECKRCRQARESTPEARKARRLRDLKQKYNLTEGDYEALLVNQQGLCGICRGPETKTNEYGETLPLVVDHDHGTNKVRGLLCYTCNVGLGLLGDNLERTEAALRYLRGN